MALSADERGLLSAIAADPGDAAARLIYADWLEEQDSADDAELIRLGGTPEGGDASHRRAELERKLRGAIAAEFPGNHGVHFACGLPSITMPIRATLLKAFGRYAPQAMRRLHVRDWRLRGQMKDWSRLADRLVLAELAALDLSCCRLGNKGAAALGASPHLGRLVSLRLYRVDITLGDVARMFSGGGLAGLCSLDLSDNRVGPRDLTALGERPGAANLRHLVLWTTGVRPAGAAALAAASGLGNLVTLDLAACSLGDTGVQALAESPYLTRLATLRLRHNSIRKAGALALARSPLVRRLRLLDLEYNAIGREAARALAEAMAPQDGSRLRLVPYLVGGAKAWQELENLMPGRVLWR